VCVLADNKSAVIFFNVCVHGHIYRRESLRAGRAVSQNELLPFSWRYFQGSPNAESRKGLGWTVFNLSDADFCNLTANISRNGKSECYMSIRA